MDLAVGDLVIDCDTVIHPLLGDAFVICNLMREPLTAMSALDFAAPSEIPIIAEPAALPPGSGSLLLNLIAERARGPLRYAGPYPTPALYRALLRSFRASASEDAFTADVLGRAMRLARDPVDVEFAPAPHRRVTFAGGFAEVRTSVDHPALPFGSAAGRERVPTVDHPALPFGSAAGRERVPTVEHAVVDGIGYGDSATTRLVDGRAELWFGTTRYAIVARFAPDGTLLAGPSPIPPLASELPGTGFPPALRAALAELVADLVPAPLARIAHDRIAERELVWADLGARVARSTPAGFEVHAGLWQFVAPEGLAQLALALADALAPVVTRTIVAELVPRPGA